MRQLTLWHPLLVPCNPLCGNEKVRNPQLSDTPSDLRDTDSGSRGIVQMVPQQAEVSRCLGEAAGTGRLSRALSPVRLGPRMGTRVLGAAVTFVYVLEEG